MAHKNHRTLVIMAFDPSTGRVSINGGAWKHLELLREVADPKLPPDAPTGRHSATDFPPPSGEGDDRPRCLLCNIHGSCTVHIWDGEWVCLGSPCTSPSCP
jgi:hypothetical protein